MEVEDAHGHAEATVHGDDLPLAVDRLRHLAHEGGGFGVLAL